MLRLLVGIFGLHLVAGSAWADSQGHCDTRQLSYEEFDGMAFANSTTTFVPVPFTDVFFTQGGIAGNPSCVLVTFSAETAGASSLVRPVLDDATPCQPADNLFGFELTPGARSRDFVCPAVDPGPHKIEMQMRAISSDPARINARVTVVRYAK